MAHDAAFSWRDAEKDLMSRIDTTVPQWARVWNYLPDGNDWYRINQQAGDGLLRLAPGLADAARASRYFLARAICYLPGEQGITQCLPATRASSASAGRALNTGRGVLGGCGFL
jgi:hypothetical protein